MELEPFWTWKRMSPHKSTAQILIKVSNEHFIRDWKGKLGFIQFKSTAFQAKLTGLIVCTQKRRDKHRFDDGLTLVPDTERSAPSLHWLRYTQFILLQSGGEYELHQNPEQDRTGPDQTRADFLDRYNIILFLKAVTREHLFLCCQWN